MVSAQLLAIAGGIVLLYVLIKGHLYAVRKLWVPKFEEEREAAPDEEGTDDEDDGVERGWDVID